MELNSTIVPRMREKPIEGPAIPLRIALPQHTKLGPSMRALANDQQRLFVCALLELGDADYRRAALAAGYTSNSDTSLYQTAMRLAHDEKVQDAIFEESKRRLQTGLILATNAVLKIVKGEGPTGQPVAARDQLRAAEMIFNRCGLPAETKGEVVHKHVDATDAERLQNVVRMAKELGIDPKKLLGSRGIVIDAEFTEVDK